MLVVNRYADEAEANSFQRAEELRPKCESWRSAPKLAVVSKNVVQEIRQGSLLERA